MQNSQPYSRMTESVTMRVVSRTKFYKVLQVNLRLKVVLEHCRWFPTTAPLLGTQSPRRLGSILPLVPYRCPWHSSNTFLCFAFLPLSLCKLCIFSLRCLSDDSQWGPSRSCWNSTAVGTFSLNQLEIFSPLLCCRHKLYLLVPISICFQFNCFCIPFLLIQTLWKPALGLAHLCCPPGLKLTQVFEKLNYL